MKMIGRTVATAEELAAAAGDPEVKRIAIARRVDGVPPLRLAPGQEVVGMTDRAAVVFVHGSDGLQLSTDNQVSSIHLAVSPNRRAVYNDPAVEQLGTLLLADVSTVGAVQILLRDRARTGHVVITGLDIVEADAGDRPERPQGLGLQVRHGVLTLWNQHADPAVVMTADLTGISAGRDREPVHGSGVLLVGGGEDAGRLEVSRLHTGALYTDGGIGASALGQISGAIFVGQGAHVREVRNVGPVTTYGINDVVLDNWGTVGSWTTQSRIVSYGDGAVAFGNVGTIAVLRLLGAVETHGQAADALRVQHVGSIGEILVGGPITATGRDSSAVSVATTR